MPATSGESNGGEVVKVVEDKWLINSTRPSAVPNLHPMDNDQRQEEEEKVGIRRDLSATEPLEPDYSCGPTVR